MLLQIYQLYKHFYTYFHFRNAHNKIYDLRKVNAEYIAVKPEVRQYGQHENKGKGGVDDVDLHAVYLLADAFENAVYRRVKIHNGDERGDKLRVCSGVGARIYSLSQCFAAGEKQCADKCGEYKRQPDALLGDKSNVAAPPQSGCFRQFGDKQGNMSGNVMPCRTP